MIINANSNRVLHIGRVGENNATKVVFDISKWIEEYGNGEVSLVIEQNGVISLIGTTDPALQFEGNKVTWLVSDAFTKMENRGRCELYYSIDNVKVKSVLFDIVVTKSLDGYEEVAPTPYDGWINQLLDASGKVSGAVEAAERAEEAQRAALASQTAAAGSASAASESATSASASASAASGSASAAAASESNAAGSASAAADSATAAQTAQSGAESSASAAQQSASAAAASESASANSAAQSKQNADASASSAATALRYVSNPPQPRSDTGTWWIYDPVNDVYVNSHEPYGIKIHRTFKSVEEMNAFTPEDFGVNVAINIPATNTENEHSEIYVYTKNGWEYLLSIVGGGGGGNGNMKDEVYDPGGSVMNAGGIPNYVKENATQVTWNKWTSVDFVG